MKKRGRFITFEGPEGAGKTTQVKLLEENLQRCAVDVVSVREPGGTQIGEAIRDLLQQNLSGETIEPSTEVLLFAASRAQLVSHRILPALEAGVWVISDRFVDSTTAYQGYGRGFQVQDISAINTFAVRDAIPDRTFLLDLPAKDGLKRVVRRGRETDRELDRIEREARSFHQRVRDGYLELARRYSDRFTVLDARQSQEEIATAIWRHLQCERSDER